MAGVSLTGCSDDYPASLRSAPLFPKGEFGAEYLPLSSIPLWCDWNCRMEKFNWREGFDFHFT
ncbi:MAG: hypothetical protein ACP5QS_06995, partial [bacterium]